MTVTAGEFLVFHRVTFSCQILVKMSRNCLRFRYLRLECCNKNKGPVDEIAFEMKTLRTLGVVLFVFVMGCQNSATVLKPTQEKLNIVFILSDDQAWGDYGFMGHKTIKTPHLDKLASESLLFKRGYVTAPLCRPSLASMMSGLHLHQHGMVGNDVTPARRTAREKEGRAQIDAFNARDSLVSCLVAAGYEAFQSGKWWEGGWKEAHFTAGMTHGVASKGGRHGDLGLKIGRTGLEPLTNFIDASIKKKKPFFVWYAPFLPHTPHNPPKRLLDKYSAGRPPDEAKYFAMCDWFDETCGGILDHLDKKKIRKNTLIVYICDNGWVAKSQSDVPVPKNWRTGFAPRSKGSPYENGIRTPIMFSYPAKIKAESSDDLAISIDLMPTILKFCGVKVPAGLSGLNLLDEKIRSQRKEIYGAAHSIHNMTVGDPKETLQYQWVITKRWKYLKRFHGSDTTHYKYVHLWDQTPEHLFDLQADPGEKKNLIGKHPEVKKQLSAKLAKFSN
jgi:arylsulfatase A-like enzyme